MRVGVVDAQSFGDRDLTLNYVRRHERGDRQPASQSQVRHGQRCGEMDRVIAAQAVSLGKIHGALRDGNRRGHDTVAAMPRPAEGAHGACRLYLREFARTYLAAKRRDRFRPRQADGV